jgi:hypothetical protein
MGLHLPPKSTLDDMAVSDIRRTMDVYHSKVTDPETGEDRHALWTEKLRTRMQPEQRRHMNSLLAHGFLQPHPKDSDTLFLTDTGQALWGAHIRKRHDLAFADKAFATLKEGVEKLDAHGIRKIAEIWIYGSYMRREPTVGDIDGTLITRRLYDHDKEAELFREKELEQPWYQKQMRTYGRLSYTNEYTVRKVFGARQATVLKGMHIDESTTKPWTLTSIYTPCQRVYTEAGGWKREEILSHHPGCTRPPDTRKEVHVTIDQGTFSNSNESAKSLNRQKRIQEATKRLAGQTTTAPTEHTTTPKGHKRSRADTGHDHSL